jgi:hypothetical protein
MRSGGLLCQSVLSHRAFIKAGGGMDLRAEQNMPDLTRPYAETVKGAPGVAVCFTLEVFAFEVVRAMNLITILNHCHHFPGFVYQRCHLDRNQNVLHVVVRPRRGSAAIWTL